MPNSKSIGCAYSDPLVSSIHVDNTDPYACIRRSYASGITAHAGGGQTSATQLIAEFNSIDTVITAGDSVKLPSKPSPDAADARGMFIVVYNNAANPLQVFGSGTDTINGIATATGCPVAPSTAGAFLCASAGKWVSFPLVGQSGALLTEYATSGITANAGGGQTNATQLATQINRVDTVATARDSVKLPASAAGLRVAIINNTSNTLQVFGSGTDKVNGVASATGVSQPPNSCDWYFCPVAGSWYAEVGDGYSGSLITESAATGITANAGGGQTNATALTAQTNRVDTVASALDSVKLPASAPGLEITIINNQATNRLAVFGTGTDTINGQAAATGVFQPPNSVDTYWCPIAGVWFAEVGAGFSGSLATESASDTITAFAGGGQTNATPLTTNMNRVTTVASIGDSVMLPPSAPGLTIFVVNHGANSMQVFGNGADRVDDQPTSVGVPQMRNSFVIYECTTAGNWYSEGLANGFAGPGLQSISFASTLAAHAGGGQVSATAITSMLALFSTVATAGDSSVLPGSVPGLQIAVINNGAQSMNVFPAAGEQINALGINSAFALPAGQNTTFSCASTGNWNTPFIPSFNQTHMAYNTNNATAGVTLIAANISGGSQEVTLNMTGTLAGAANAQLPTVANLVAAIPNATAGQSYQLRVINSSSANFAWTVTTNTGWTLNGSMSVSQNTWRDFYITLTSLTAATMQNVGTGTYS